MSVLRRTRRNRPSPLHGNLIEGKSGRFTAYFDEFPEIVAEGENEKEAKENLVEAIQEVLAYRKADTQQHTPQIISEKPIKHFKHQIA